MGIEIMKFFAKKAVPAKIETKLDAVELTAEQLNQVAAGCFASYPSHRLLIIEAAELTRHSNKELRADADKQRCVFPHI